MSLNVTSPVDELPEDLLWALDAHPLAQAIFDQFSPSHRREYILWIESARSPETRAQRIDQAIALIVVAQEQV